MPPALDEARTQPTSAQKAAVSAVPAIGEGSSAAALVLDHLGLIVPALPEGQAFLAAALGITSWSAVTEDSGLGVAVQFGSVPAGTSAAGQALVYELIAPLGPSSPVANALRGGKHILNHLAYLTPDLAASGHHLEAQGCRPVGPPQPALAYAGSPVQFWMSPLRFVLELIEKPGHRHDLLPAAPTRDSR